jgi:hypothetical protein
MACRKLRCWLSACTIGLFFLCGSAVASEYVRARLFQLTHAKAEEVATAIRKAYSAKSAPPIRVDIYPRSNQLRIDGAPAVMEAASAIIYRMEGFIPTERVYRPPVRLASIR